MKTGVIVAIGGGSLSDVIQQKIHRRIVGYTNKKNSKVLFIPTASSDDKSYESVLEDLYVKKLGCEAEYLYLIADRPSREEISDKIMDADLIYVPGGNTLKMMRLWRKFGVDVVLKKSLKNGTIMSGKSAGSICWFDSGHSDSISYYNTKKWHYINVRGMGIVKGIHCPHYDSETLGVKRKTDFHNMIRKTGKIGIAIDDNCCIEFKDDTFRVFSAKNGANAYRVFKQKERVVSEKIPIRKDFLHVSKLYEKNFCD